LLAAGTAALGIAACVFAVSKGALLGILAGLVVYGLTVKKLRPMALILVIASCIAVLAYQPLFQKASSIFSLSDDSSSVRVIVWDETFRMLADRPVFGAGLNGYQQALAPYHLAKHIEIFMYPHNILLNYWSELGMIGLVGFIWLLILFFIRNARLHHLTSAWLPLGLLAAMVAVVVHGFVDVPYFKNDLAFLFWIMFGLSESLLLRADHPGFWDSIKRKVGLVSDRQELDGIGEA
jgi:O-antigen ligase